MTFMNNSEKSRNVPTYADHCLFQGYPTELKIMSSDIYRNRYLISVGDTLYRTNLIYSSALSLFVKK